MGLITHDSSTGETRARITSAVSTENLQPGRRNHSEREGSRNQRKRNFSSSSPAQTSTSVTLTSTRPNSPQQVC